MTGLFRYQLSGVRHQAPYPHPSAVMPAKAGIQEERGSGQGFPTADIASEARQSPGYLACHSREDTVCSHSRAGGNPVAFT